MNNLEYLNQISQENRPVKTKGTTTFTSLILKLIIGGIVALALIIALGIIISNTKTKSSDLTKQLFFRTTSLNETIKDFNPSLKSSKLRAIGTSLANTLTSASGQLSTYLGNQNTEDTSPSPSALKTETENINTLNLTLNNAKLNGILDRIYANQIQFQVSILLSLITQTIDHSKNSDLLSILQQYHSSIENVNQSLQEYSNPNA